MNDTVTGLLAQAEAPQATDSERYEIVREWVTDPKHTSDSYAVEKSISTGLLVLTRKRERTGEDKKTGLPREPSFKRADLSIVAVGTRLGLLD